MCRIHSLKFSVYIYIYIYNIYMYTKVIQKVLSLTQILDLSHNFHFHLRLTCIEIKTEICISFSSFI